MGEGSAPDRSRISEKLSNFVTGIRDRLYQDEIAAVGDPMWACENKNSLRGTPRYRSYRTYVSTYL